MLNGPRWFSCTCFFTATFNEAGKKLIEVNGRLGSVIVKGVVPTPEQIALPASEGTSEGAEESAESEGFIAAAPNQDVSDTPDSSDIKGWQIAIPVIGACIVVFVIISVLVLRWRRNQERSP
jgi:hypothetical protein